MKFRVIELPPFTAATSGVDLEMDFSDNGILGKFNRYFSKIKPLPKDNFMPRDFLLHDSKVNGLEWWWALAEGMDDGGYEHVEFEGGYYVCYYFVDQDNDTNEKLYQEALQYIKDSNIFELDIREKHYSMGHIITPHDIIELQGFALMEAFIPVKLK